MADLTTLAKVKSWLGLTVTDSDSLLSLMITQYSEQIENYITRNILSASYTDFYDGVGGSMQMFANYPVTAVSSVKINGVSVPAAASFNEVGYRFTPTTLILQGLVFTRGMANVEVTYTAGYASVPPDIDRACVELVGLRFREKERIGQSSKSLSGETTAFITKDFPDSVKTTLKPYRRTFTS